MCNYEKPHTTLKICFMWDYSWFILYKTINRKKILIHILIKINRTIYLAIFVEFLGCCAFLLLDGDVNGTTLAAFLNKCQQAARCPPLITSHQWIISLCCAILALPIVAAFSKRKNPNGSSGAIRSWW